jgi:hypothetical protein
MVALQSRPFKAHLISIFQMFFVWRPETFCAKDLIASIRTFWGSSRAALAILARSRHCGILPVVHSLLGNSSGRRRQPSPKMADIQVPGPKDRDRRLFRTLRLCFCSYLLCFCLPLQAQHILYNAIIDASFDISHYYYYHHLLRFKTPKSGMPKVHASSSLVAAQRCLAPRGTTNFRRFTTIQQFATESGCVRCNRQTRGFAQDLSARGLATQTAGLRRPVRRVLPAAYVAGQRRSYAIGKHGRHIYLFEIYQMLIFFSRPR